MLERETGGSSKEEMEFYTPEKMSEAKEIVRRLETKDGVEEVKEGLKELKKVVEEAQAKIKLREKLLKEAGQ